MARVAIRQGRKIVKRLFVPPEPPLPYSTFGSKKIYDNLATVICSHPPIGLLGLSEEQARKEYGRDRVKVHRSQLQNIFDIGPDDFDSEMRYHFKLICYIEKDKWGNPTERIVGWQCIARDITEIFRCIHTAVSLRGTLPEEYIMQSDNFLFSNDLNVAG